MDNRFQRIGKGTEIRLELTTKNEMQCQFVGVENDTVIVSFYGNQIPIQASNIKNVFWEDQDASGKQGTSERVQTEHGILYGYIYVNQPQYRDYIVSYRKNVNGYRQETYLVNLNELDRATADAYRNAKTAKQNNEPVPVLFVRFQTQTRNERLNACKVTLVRPNEIEYGYQLFNSRNIHDVAYHFTESCHERISLDVDRRGWKYDYFNLKECQPGTVFQICSNEESCIFAVTREQNEAVHDIIEKGETEYTLYCQNQYKQLKGIEEKIFRNILKYMHSMEQIVTSQYSTIGQKKRAVGFLVTMLIVLNKEANLKVKRMIRDDELVERCMEESLEHCEDQFEDYDNLKKMNTVSRYWNYRTEQVKQVLRQNAGRSIEYQIQYIYYLILGETEDTLIQEICSYEEAVKECLYGNMKVESHCKNLLLDTLMKYEEGRKLIHKLAGENEKLAMEAYICENYDYFRNTPNWLSSYVIRMKPGILKNRDMEFSDVWRQIKESQKILDQQFYDANTVSEQFYIVTEKMHTLYDEAELQENAETAVQLVQEQLEEMEEELQHSFCMSAVIVLYRQISPLVKDSVKQEILQYFLKELELTDAQFDASYKKYLTSQDYASNILENKTYSLESNEKINELTEKMSGLMNFIHTFLPFEDEPILYEIKGNLEGLKEVYQQSHLKQHDCFISFMESIRCIKNDIADMTLFLYRETNIFLDTLMEQSSLILNRFYEDESKWPKLIASFVETECYKQGRDQDLENKAMLRIFIQNDRDNEGCQPARNIQITADCIPEVILEQDTNGVTNLGSGKGRTMVIRLSNLKGITKLDEVKVKISYQYHISCEEEKTKEIEIISPVTFKENSFPELENPYLGIAGGNEVSDRKMYFGRDTIMGKVLKVLPNGMGNDCSLVERRDAASVILYGERRIGKSTIRRQLEENLKETSDQNIVFDVKLSRCKPELFPNCLYEQILVRLKDTLCNSKAAPVQELWEDISNNHPELFPNVNVIEKESMEEVFFDFYMKFNSYIFNQPCGRQYYFFLVIDEFTTIHRWVVNDVSKRDGYLECWKELFTGRNSISSIIIGQMNMKEWIGGSNNIGRSIAAMSIHRIYNLTPEDIQIMITQAPLGGRSEEKTYAQSKSEINRILVDKIMKASIGCAYIVTNLLSEIITIMQEEQALVMTDLELDKAVMSIAEEPMRCRNLLSGFYSDDLSFELGERAKFNEILFDIIAKSNDYACGFEDIRKRLAMRCKRRGIATAISKEQAENLLNNLMERQLIEKCSSGKYQIKPRLLLQYQKDN